MKCSNCNYICRVLPDNLEQFKHYTKEIIENVIDRKISEDDIDFEDYPCEMTMKRWRSQKSQRP